MDADRHGWKATVGSGRVHRGDAEGAENNEIGASGNGNADFSHGRARKDAGRNDGNSIPGGAGSTTKTGFLGSMDAGLFGGVPDDPRNDSGRQRSGGNDRGQGSEVRGQRSGARGQGSEAGGQ
jgi:hypothetical protein